ncbi:hypothetical protein [Candidatus Lokiarchaeum ossiferum]|uniref:hypothetical protein n=1 Tax=Candidatus Lokiarchaeum ossiferum TaxID=2951803 RepID=UPI00352FA2AA
MIFFDLEFYVPPEERNHPNSRGTLVFNPGNPNHIILGGHFISLPISSIKSEDQASFRHDTSFWIWNYSSEETLLGAIKNFFEEEFSFQQGQNTQILEKRVKDVVTCGFAIARIDLPALYIRSQYHHIAPTPNLFEIFLKSKVIDLCNVSAFLFPNETTLYPKTAYEVSKRLFPHTKWKPSGKSVWKYYDEGEYEQIETRCHNEVTDILHIYKKLQSYIGLPRND